MRHDVTREVALAPRGRCGLREGRCRCSGAPDALAGCRGWWCSAGAGLSAATTSSSRGPSSSSSGCCGKAARAAAISARGAGTASVAAWGPLLRCRFLRLRPSGGGAGPSAAALSLSPAAWVGAEDAAAGGRAPGLT